VTQAPHIGADQLRTALSPVAAVDAISEVLAGRFDPADDVVRSSVDTAHGQFLLMPSERGDFAGVKVVTVAPGNPSFGLPRIQGVYLLFDALTLTLLATFDAAALTTLRTPAVSLAAVRPALARIHEPIRVVVFGTGPQALGHLDTLVAVADQPIGSVVFIARNPARVDPSVTGRGRVIAVAGEEAHAALSVAHMVVCATTAREPLFPADAIAPDAIVIAVGSHEPTARELDGALLGRATVIVEDVATALREAGDVIMAIDEGTLDPGALIPIKDVFTGATQLSSHGTVVFKSVGMSWEDLAVAAAAHRADK
jgi:ornithine cyclodeaminase/alanine dehydrogenase-like protein (mu-crystallin family)